MAEADARGRDGRDESDPSPLRGGDPMGPSSNSGEVGDRHIRVGVSHPSDNPALHRVFEVTASFDAAAGGWVARAREENLNEQLQGGRLELRDGERAPAFSTAAACLGDAVAKLVAATDREDAEPE